jgi:general stress protein 26
MFITNNREDENTRPMATIETDDDGTLWFFTDIRSIKVEEVNADHSVHLIYAHPGKESYLDVWGSASVITDKQNIKDKWSPIVKAWFPNGVDDSNLALLRVQPEDVYYWDAEAGKMVSFLKIIAGAVTGRPSLSSDAKGAIKL